MIVSRDPLVYETKMIDLKILSEIIPLGNAINQRFDLKWEAHDVDTIAGLMIAQTDKLLAPGDQVELSGASVEVLGVKGPRAIRIRLTLPEPSPDQNK